MPAGLSSRPHRHEEQARSSAHPLGGYAMEQPGRHVTSELLRIGEMRASASGGRTRCHRHDRASAIAPINRICANRGGAVTFRSARRTARRRALSLTFCQLTVMAVPCLRSCSRIGGRPSRRASLMNLRLDTQVCRGGRPGGRRRTRRPAQVVVGRGGRKDLPGPGSMARTRCGHVCVIAPGPDEAAQ
jgi:hypothetical protein